MKGPDSITIGNDKVRLELSIDQDNCVQRLRLYGANQTLFLTLGPELGLFLGKVKRKGEHKSSIPFKFIKKLDEDDEQSLEFISDEGLFDVKLEIKINGTEYISFNADIRVKKNVTANFLRFDFHYPFKEPMDLVRVPHTRRKKHYIMGDHKLGTPAIVISKDEKSIALIADVTKIPENRKFKTHMDMNHLDNGRISYGFRNYYSHRHVMFKSKPSTKIRFKPAVQEDLELAFLMRLGVDESKDVLLHEVSKFLWNYFGKAEFKKILPQTVPFEQLAPYSFDRMTDPAIYDLYREFEYDGETCAGLIYRGGTGVSRGKFDIVEPAKVEKFIEKPIYDHWYIIIAFYVLFNHPRILDFIGRRIQKHVAENYEWFWNQAWFLNVRTAFSLRGLGSMLKNSDYNDRANKIINLAIKAPRESGFFPSMFVITTEGLRWIEGTTGFDPHHAYNTVDIALAGYWMLKYAQEFDYRKDEIIERLRITGDKLLKLQLDSGAIPTIVRVEPKVNGRFEIVPQKGLLHETPGSCAIGMLFCELYKCTSEEKFLAAAKKIVPFLEREILPFNKWYDFETFHSCTAYARRFPESRFRDPYTLCLPQNTLSIYWTAELLRNLYEITKDKKYLSLGTYVIDYLSTFQQLFNAKFLKLSGFGGFYSQNNDAEWNDARQGLFARELMEYYLLTEEEMYLERAVAALKASFVLTLHEKNKLVAPGNFRWITEEDYGANFENYGHHGIDHPVQGVVTIDWSWGTSVMAFVTLHKKLGDLFIDLKNKKAYGINACSVQKTAITGGTFSIFLDVLPEKSRIFTKFHKPEDLGQEITKIKLVIIPTGEECELKTFEDVQIEVFKKFL